MSDNRTAEEIFTQIYKDHIWSISDYKSGNGSAFEYNNNTYIPFMVDFIQKNEITTLVDLGAGEFLTRYILEGLPSDYIIKYMGYDIYGDIVTHNNEHFKPYQFIHMDIYEQKENLISADMCILKDVLQHWTLSQVYTFLDFLVKTRLYKYIIIINCSYQNIDYTNETQTVLGGFMPLSNTHYPLKKYKTTLIYQYHTKSVYQINY
jgi:hypothetical protein